MAGIRVKNIREPADPGDGARLLVDRLWPRGISKEQAALTLWLREIAPSDALRKAIHAMPEGEERWAAFTASYEKELEREVQQQALAELRSWMKKGTVTLLYAASNRERNNAVALRDWIIAADAGKTDDGSA